MELPYYFFVELMRLKNHVYLLSIGLALTISAIVSKPVWAHPADMFFQSYDLEFTSEGLRLTWSMTPGSLIVPALWTEVDRDYDGKVSEPEAQSWIGPHLAEFTAALNETTPLTWRVERIAWPESFESFQGGTEDILIDLTAEWPTGPADTVHLSLHNRFQESISINRFILQGADGIKFYPPQQTNGALQVELAFPTAIPVNTPSTTPSERTLLAGWDSGTPSLESPAVEAIGAAAEARGAEEGQAFRFATTLNTLMQRQLLLPSLLLALVLIVIGLVLVQRRRLFERVIAFDRITPAMPVVSVAIVLALGMILAYNAVRSSRMPAFFEIFPAQGDAPALTQTAQSDSEKLQPPNFFDIEQAEIVYLVQNQPNAAQLFVHELATERSRPLTQNLRGIKGYALSPDKTTAAYAIEREDGSTALWRTNTDGSDQRLLLDCPIATCRQAAWSPDGQRLLYERRELPTLENSLGLPSIWEVDVSSGETRPVFQDDRWPGFNPDWSPNGQWLAYSSPGSNNIEIYNLIDGRRHSAPNRTGSPALWHPGSQAILFQDVVRQADSVAVHLFHYDLERQDVIDLSAGSSYEDSSAAWSPDGEWIAVVRRDLSAGHESLGRQIWLMRSDGSETRPLTDASEIFYGAVSWSPDGHFLLYHRYSLEALGQPEVWLLDIETVEQKPVAAGLAPAWLP